MCLELRRVDHDGFLIGALGGQPLQHPGEDPHVTLSLPTVLECLRRAIFSRRITPPQAIAIDEDYAAQDAVIIDARLPMTVRKKRFQPLHLLVRQPE